jgi:hypothetical protein
VRLDVGSGLGGGCVSARKPCTLPWRARETVSRGSIDRVSDDDLLLLARAAEASPDDLALLLRAGRELARVGETARGEAALVAALDRVPGDPVATELLDALGGGRAIGAVWPSPRGDARCSGRANIEGPMRGRVAARIRLDLPRPVEGLAIDARGRAIVTSADSLLEVALDGSLRQLAKLDRHSGRREVVLLPGGRVLLLGATQALALIPRGTGQAGATALARVPHRAGGRARAWAAGASGLLYAAAAAAVVSWPIAEPAERRSLGFAPGDGDMGLAIAPGGDLVVAAEGDPRHGRAALIERRDAAGALRWSLALPPCHFARGHTNPVVAPDGTAYLAFQGERVRGIDASGAPVFDAEYAGELVAFAGEGERLLLCRARHAIAALDRVTGAPRWRRDDAFVGPLPKVDRRGVAYVRREDDLVALDPVGGEAIAEWPLVGRRQWDFAFAGPGVIWAFVREGDESALVVLE